MPEGRYEIWEVLAVPESNRGKGFPGVAKCLFRTDYGRSAFEENKWSSVDRWVRGRYSG
jgi:hypothetical protein